MDEEAARDVGNQKLVDINNANKKLNQETPQTAGERIKAILRKD